MAQETKWTWASGIIPNLEGAALDEAIQASVNHRRLNPRQIQLASIAGAIGAYVFRKPPSTHC